MKTYYIEVKISNETLVLAELKHSLTGREVAKKIYGYIRTAWRGSRYGFTLEKGVSNPKSDSLTLMLMMTEGGNLLKFLLSLREDVEHALKLHQDDVILTLKSIKDNTGRRIF